MNFIDSLEKFWLIISFIITGGITSIVAAARLSNRVTTVEKDLKAHTIMDDKLFTELKVSLTNDKKELISLIDRNKEATEKAGTKTENKLEKIGEDMAVVKNQLNLIITNKIKIG